MLTKFCICHDHSCHFFKYTYAWWLSKSFIITLVMQSTLRIFFSASKSRQNKKNCFCWNRLSRHFQMNVVYGRIRYESYHISCTCTVWSISVNTFLNDIETRIHEDSISCRTLTHVFILCLTLTNLKYLFDVFLWLTNEKLGYIRWKWYIFI